MRFIKIYNECMELRTIEMTYDSFDTTHRKRASELVFSFYLVSIISECERKGREKVFDRSICNKTRYLSDSGFQVSRFTTVWVLFFTSLVFSCCKRIASEVFVALTNDWKPNTDGKLQNGKLWNNLCLTFFRAIFRSQRKYRIRFSGDIRVC